jgi:chromosome-anchoring protein RacA
MDTTFVTQAGSGRRIANNLNIKIPNGVIEMSALKTKDAAEALGVSQTTIKRWVFNFSHTFQKDRFGHYIFTEQDISRLHYIKSRVELGDSIDQITLPSDIPAEPAKNDKDGDDDTAEMISRIRQIERSLAQKADEVVSMQILQHRKELEELRRVVEQLAASVESMQGPAPKQPGLQEEIHNSAMRQVHNKKRSLFRSLFQFL